MRHRAKARRRRREANSLYRCEACGAEEHIAAEVLTFFDVVDPGAPGAPATFRCESCPGIMYPDGWFRAERAAP
jgi:uncharacterized Zn finger protein